MCKIIIDGEEVKSFSRPISWESINGVISEIKTKQPLFSYITRVEIRTFTSPEEAALRLEMRRGAEENENPQLNAYRKKVAANYHNHKKQEE